MACQMRMYTLIPLIPYTLHNIILLNTYTYTMLYTAMWLTLLARARKHTRTYPWASLKQVLLGKARDLLKLPTGEGVTGV